MYQWLDDALLAYSNCEHQRDQMPSNPVLSIILALSILLPLKAVAAETELLFDPASKKWERQAAGEQKSKARKKWANTSPVTPEIVSSPSELREGTILVRTDERRLYFALGNGKAKRFGIGVGREGFEWKGRERITRKAEWPGWTPPEEMKKREAANGRILPDYVEGGRENPLGARALYLGQTAFRIHGTNEPWTIGNAVSSGCIRMANEDIIELYSLAKVGATVIVE
jgi:lipoprotein-anchoring transpeptidase ErfK/SrfK